MKAAWKVHTILGLTAFLLTYFFSIVNNTWQMSLFKAGIGFLIFFLFGYILLFVLQQIGSMGKKDQSQKQKVIENFTPETSQKNLEDEQSFQAIPLNSLHNQKDVNDSEEHEHMIRTWTSQNQEG